MQNVLHWKIPRSFFRAPHTSIITQSSSLTHVLLLQVTAFGLGFFLTPMPAVRNFSLCACLAVLLDFVLQVCTDSEHLTAQWK